MKFTASSVYNCVTQFLPTLSNSRELVRRLREKTEILVKILVLGVPSRATRVPKWCSKTQTSNPSNDGPWHPWERGEGLESDSSSAIAAPVVGRGIRHEAQAEEQIVMRTRTKQNEMRPCL